MSVQELRVALSRDNINGGLTEQGRRSAATLVEEYVAKVGGALTRLANEVEAILSLAREDIRSAAGSTNLAVLELRLKEAREAGA